MHSHKRHKTRTTFNSKTFQQCEMQENNKGKRFLESLFSQLEREESEQQENVMANHPEFNHCDICPLLANKVKRLPVPVTCV